MKQRFLLFWLVSLLVLQYMNAQSIVTTPIVGAVTDSSASILFFTEKETTGKLFLYLNQNNHYELSYSFNTENKVARIALSHLQANYLYYYSILPDGDSISHFGSFKTFPKNYSPANYSFTFGSCTEQHHRDSIFIEMQKQQPLFFMHIGDWLYSDNFQKGNFYYLENEERLQSIYKLRYTMPNLSKMMHSTPIDYIFDDEDGIHDDFSKKTYTEIHKNGNEITLDEISYPVELKTQLYSGLAHYFPAYPAVTPEKAYHSFLCGNAEFFVLDTRSTRSPNTEVFHKKGNYWSYKVPSGHHILDSAQFNWLKDKLKNSKAQWKFIVSGVTFNASYKKVLDLMLLKRVQKRKLPNDMTGAYVAASLSAMWFAFPETQNELLDFCRNNQIKNVIMLSGDAHTAAIDDGKNAGFPELMAASLAQENSKLAGILFNNLKLNLWNKGGQGIGNANYTDAFGQVTVNGTTSVTLAAIDKNGNTICRYEVQDGFLPKKTNARKSRKITLGSKIKAAKQALIVRKSM